MLVRLYHLSHFTNPLFSILVRNFGKHSAQAQWWLEFKKNNMWVFKLPGTVLRQHSGLSLSIFWSGYFWSENSRNK
jgi:hypothetical protein